MRPHDVNYATYVPESGISGWSSEPPHPIRGQLLTRASDLFSPSDDSEDEYDLIALMDDEKNNNHNEFPTDDSSILSGGHSQLMKIPRSSQFYTTVKPSKVLEKIHHIMEECIKQETVTPIGIISKCIAHHKAYAMEIWSREYQDKFACKINVFMMVSKLRSPDDKTQSEHLYHILDEGKLSEPQQFLVEFVRGPSKIFEFRKFYQWIRSKLIQIVNKDYKMYELGQAHLHISGNA